MKLSELLFSRTGLIAAWALLVLIQLPIRDVMPPDEPRFAHQAQSMRTSGEWIVPYIGDEIVIDKPPVLFWGVALASLPFDRVTEATSRVPSAIAALIVLLLTARLGRRLFQSDAIGYGGALIALTGVEFFQKSQWCSCDMTMAAFAFSAITLWSESCFGDPIPDRSSLRIALGWTAVAFGILTKGPVTFLWALFWCVGEAIARRRFRPLLRIALNPGILILVAIVGGWLYALGSRAGWAFVYDATIHQNLNRYAKAWNSVQPWWFYGYQAPADLLPWAAFLPAAIAMAIRRDVASRALAFYALFGLLFFSGSSGKRGVYVMEAFPAISLLIAAAVVRAGLGRIGFVLLTTLGIALGVAAPLAIAMGVLAIPSALAAAAGAIGLVALVLGGVVLAAGAVFGLMALRRGRNESALASVVVGALVVMLLAGTIGGRTWSRMQRARPFCETMDAAVPKTERIAVEVSKYEQMMFYTLRTVSYFRSDAALVDILTRGECRYAIVERERFARLQGAAPLTGLAILAEAPISNRSYVLLGPARR